MNEFDRQNIKKTRDRIIALEGQRDRLIESLKEMRDACAAAMRVIMTHNDYVRLANYYDTELEASGVKQGFGKRADDLIREVEGDNANSRSR